MAYRQQHQSIGVTRREIGARRACGGNLCRLTKLGLSQTDSGRLGPPLGQSNGKNSQSPWSASRAKGGEIVSPDGVFARYSLCDRLQCGNLHIAIANTGALRAPIESISMSR